MQYLRGVRWPAPGSREGDNGTVGDKPWCGGSGGQVPREGGAWEAPRASDLRSTRTVAGKREGGSSGGEADRHRLIGAPAEEDEERMEEEEEEEKSGRWRMTTRRWRR